MSAVQIHLDRVQYHHGAELILEAVSWEIQEGQKIGLVGPNGAGKSTLLRLITGELQRDEGHIVHHATRIGYLAQDPVFKAGTTVWDTVLSANTDLHAVETRMRMLEARMGDPEVLSDASAFERVLAQHARAQEAFEELEGYRYESRCRQALQTVGFVDRDFDLPVGVLSGGQKKMLGLAMLLAIDCDVLLLDEPDNHLDLPGKARLEQFILGFAGTVVIVSHDRYLLDETVSFIAEVEDHRITLYQGNYSAYATEKQLRLLRQQQLYEAQQKEIQRIEEAIARFELWASLVINERHIRQARSRQKMLARMDRIEKPLMERETMGLALDGWRGSNKVLEIIELDKAFGDDVVLLGLNLLIWRGERVGLLGANGSGKSVLLRCILGQETPTSGVIKVGPSVRIGTYAQEHETLDPSRTLIEEIWNAKSMSEHAAVNFLRRFLFPYRRTRDTVATLSGGERSRLQLAKLMLSDANFLLLDEPTNNLDLPSCEVLEQALDEFEGTVLVISHDRYFLDRTVTRIVDLEDGALTEYAGDYTYYRERRQG
ncbi:MAG: ABC-F family ATP-binding cassette domain-containing protein [Anaerolineae bacterium]|nr:ABC-F family ATP-binding cassette domain-containing protein [Anaerolineae bacterium]